jgi:hypothetical protein
VTKRLLLLGFGVGLIALTAATARPRRQAEAPDRPLQAQWYLYCPECGLEMTCPPGDEERATFCPRCSMKRRMELNRFSRGSDGGPRPQANRAMIVAAFGVPVVLALIVYAVGWVRAKREQTPEGESRRAACPGCGHKMTTAVFAPGSTAACPVCREQFVVPGQRRAPDNEHGAREWGAWLGSELTKKRRD